MRKKNIEVYWSPAPFTENERQWNRLYQEPVPVFYDLANKNKGSLVVQCPAFQQTAKNLFSLNSQIDDFHEFEPGILEAAKEAKVFHQPLNSKGAIPLQQPRESQIKDNINLTYNMSWLFYASEPLEMRMSAPYFPSVSPSTNAKLAFGEFDIGKWFRPLQLDYHLPLDTKTFTVKENQPLAFIEFQTDAKIVFRRFKLTKHLDELAKEFVDTTRFYKGIGLAKRYTKMGRTGTNDLVLSEIKKNLI